MSREYLTLGTCPSDEECVQVSRDKDYYADMYQECKLYQLHLENLFPDQPGSVHFGVKSFPHDFGSYCEVVVYYDDQDEEEVDFAINCENNIPEKWEPVNHGNHTHGVPWGILKKGFTEEGLPIQ